MMDRPLVTSALVPTAVNLIGLPESLIACAAPSALPEIAVLVAFTISATFDSFEPVNWNSQLSSAQASWAPYWVGVKNGLVVTWLTNTNFHLGVEGKSP